MGGARPGSGRKTRFPGKVRRTVSLTLTDEGTDILDYHVEREGASMSDVVEQLLRMQGRSQLVGFPPLPEAKAAL